MARLNVYVPDELAERARARGLNVSTLTQAAISAELESSGTDTWLATLAARTTTARHADVLDAIDASPLDNRAGPGCKSLRDRV